MPESVCLSMILGNALGRSLSLSSNSSWCICFTDPCGSRRKPSADNRTLRPGTSKFAPVARLARRDVMPLHTDLPTPCEYGVGREFRAVVADDHLTCGSR